MKIPFQLRKVINLGAQHSADILTVVNGIGVVATGILSGKAGAQIHDKIRAKEAELERKLTFKEQLELTWKDYILPVATGGLTIAAGVASNRVQAKQIAEIGLLAAAYSDKVKVLEKKLEETIGPEELKKAAREDGEKRLPQSISMDSEIEVYEPVSKQWFRTTRQEIIFAELTANKMFQGNQELKMNDYLSLFRHAKPMKGGDAYGWFVGDDYSDYNWSFYNGGTPWIDIAPQIFEKPNGDPALQMSYGMWPYPEDLTRENDTDLPPKRMFYENKRTNL